MTWAFLVDSVPFTTDVRDGLTSLGGSESACLGLARALKARGHDVHVYAARLTDDARGTDAWGVVWHPVEHFHAMNAFVEWDVVVSLRMYHFFAETIHARLRVLWNQDLLVPGAGDAVMSIAWALDKAVYVSEYHRHQWEDLQPELTPLGWVTKNGYDPAHVPTNAVKDPNRIIYISRPERGIAPLLAMWPTLKAQKPDAVLQICRYQSMYDGEGSNVRAMCLSYDEQVRQVNAHVGGIEYLGQLNKAQLYTAISEAAVMWYPGVADFAETSCIAAIEAQACGTPFVGSLKGALPETARPSFEAGLLLAGDATDEAYQAQSIAAVLSLMDGCRHQAREYRDLQRAGRQHVAAYTYDAIAAEWETQVGAWFRERYESNKLRIMRQLLHEDDHCAAKVVALDVMADGKTPGRVGIVDAVEATSAIEFCDRVIAGLEQGADDYAAHAIQDPLKEVEHSGRLQTVARYFDGATRVLDVACGNGAGAICIALANPSVRVVGIDYAKANIEHAIEAAQRAGVADRCTFLHASIWDLPQNRPDPAGADVLAEIIERDGLFDGAFVGEFLEHVAACDVLIDFVEAFCADGARAVYTMPVGPFGELVPRGQPIQRGHVHCFKHDDVHTVFGLKAESTADYFAIGVTPRGVPIGHWLVKYRVAPGRPARSRNLVARAQRTRPMERLTVGLIARNAETDLARCLQSVWNIADEIVVGDTGSTDDTIAIAEKFGARVLHLPPLAEIAEGFAGARNAVLDAATGEWFLWIDADETLVYPHTLRRYLAGPVYNGFVIRQHHLQLDAGPSFDIPVRLFRRAAPIRFYGCIHEQPQMGDCNGDILPTLEVVDVKIAHTGYVTEDVRRDKMLSRNLPLLVRDQQVFPDRELGKVLVLRDYVNLSDYDCQAHGGMTAKARQGYLQAVELFLAHFDDPAHKLHGIARPWYEVAMQRLGLGMEIECSLAGREGGMQGHRAKPERLWVRDAAEFTRQLMFRVERAAQNMRPKPTKTDPFVLPHAVQEDQASLA